MRCEHASHVSRGTVSSRAEQKTRCAVVITAPPVTTLRSRIGKHRVRTLNGIDRACMRILLLGGLSDPRATAQCARFGGHAAASLHLPDARLASTRKTRSPASLSSFGALAANPGGCGPWRVARV